MTDYTVSFVAARDVEEIGKHIFIADEMASRRLMRDIISSFEFLAASPDAGHLRQDLTSKPLRFWTVRRRYLVVYRRRGTEVEIIRVLDGRRDVASLL